MNEGQSLARAEGVLDELRMVLKTEDERGALQRFAEILRQNFSYYNWVGIYLVKGDKLVLEAYSGDGETEHVTIPIGNGICGFAAKSGETLVVPDVSRDPRYLMCFPSTRSEIVVPVKGKSGVIGEIDIDSDRLSAFSKSDEQFLESAASELARFLDSPWQGPGLKE